MPIGRAAAGVLPAIVAGLPAPLAGQATPGRTGETERSAYTISTAPASTRSSR